MNPEPTPPPAGGLPALETVAGADVGEFPAISERVVAAANPALAKPTAPETPPPAGSGVRDALGREFDSRRFRTDKLTGNPFTNARGEFMPKGGRPKGGQTKFPKSVMQPAAAPVSTVPAQFSTPTPAPTAERAGNATQPAAATASRSEIPADQIGLTAEGYLRTCYVLADSVLDGKGEWQPEDAAEHDGLKGATVAYLKTQQGEPMPPGLALAVSVAGYAFKRVTKSNTAKTLRHFWGKITGNKTAVPVQPAAPVRSAPTANQPATAPMSFEMPGL